MGTKKEPTPSRYRWTYKGVTFDWYRLTEILGLKSQPQIHAIKKLIRAGQSIKSTTQDIDEAIDALNRWQEMIKEEVDTAYELDKRVIKSSSVGPTHSDLLIEQIEKEARESIKSSSTRCNSLASLFKLRRKKS